MAIEVEFYGTVRRHAQIPRTVLATIDAQIRLGEAVAILAGRFPSLAEAVFQGNRLRAGYLASVDGERFVSEPTDVLRDGQTLVLMSSDAGG